MHFQTEQAIAEEVDGCRRELVEEIVSFGIDYALRARKDHSLFVDAFRESRIGAEPTR